MFRYTQIYDVINVVVDDAAIVFLLYASKPITGFYYFTVKRELTYIHTTIKMIRCEILLVCRRIEFIVLSLMGSKHPEFTYLRFSVVVDHN